MVSAKPNVSASYPARKETVAEIRRVVTEFAAAAGMRAERLDALRLAVSEAATNALVHGYRGEPGEIQLTAQIVGRDLWVLIADSGYGHNVAAKTPGLGLGLPLITRSADEFTLLERANGGTEARMRFAL